MILRLCLHALIILAIAHSTHTVAEEKTGCEGAMDPHAFRAWQNGGQQNEVERPSHGQQIINFVLSLGVTRSQVDSLFNNVRRRGVGGHVFFSYLAEIIRAKFEEQEITPSLILRSVTIGDARYLPFLRRLETLIGETRDGVESGLEWAAEPSSGYFADSIYIDPTLLAFGQAGMPFIFATIVHEASHKNNSIEIEYEPKMAYRNFHQKNFRKYSEDELNATLDEFQMWADMIAAGIKLQPNIDFTFDSQYDFIAETLSNPNLSRNQQRQMILNMIMTTLADADGSGYIDRWTAQIQQAYLERRGAEILNEAIILATNTTLPGSERADSLLSLFADPSLGFAGLAFRIEFEEILFSAGEGKFGEEQRKAFKTVTRPVRAAWPPRLKVKSPYQI